MLNFDFGPRGDHQKKCHKKIHGIREGRAIVVMPTGAGKSWNEYLAILDGFARSSSYEVSAILSPRIALAVQHIREFDELAKTLLLQRLKYLCVHSGRDENIDFMSELDSEMKVVTTTSIDEIQTEIRQANENGIHLVVFSTYHSYDRLQQALLREDITGDTLVNDECQYLVQSNFEWILDPCGVMPFRRVLNFTATPKKNIKSPEGVSMSNLDRFGKLIHRNTPKQMIDAGVIVPPRIIKWFVDSSGHRVTDQAQLLREIVKTMTNKYGKNIKIIVNADGTEFIRGFVEAKSLAEFWQDIDEEIPVFSLTANTGPMLNDHKLNSRRQLIEQINASKRCIVMHYDTLSEGIDVKGFTDVVQLRFPEVAKTCQQIGRGTRVHELDRMQLNEGKIKPGTDTGWVKPNCRVHVMYAQSNDVDTNDKIVELIANLKKGGFPVEEHREDRNNGVYENTNARDLTEQDSDTQLETVDWDVDLTISYEESNV